ncbi:putative monovalent cation:proton antiporter [Tripterygium wilfordii]|uniref:Putative monovalent cation:proton antiporter n=1 Tax=Tripterygium wilfordii TaxID=458696 RepID=A0A7J7DEL1_TRIWF|nr:putative monovalent cation:proton antiporter [Tripterygium wilfordii]
MALAGQQHHHHLSAPPIDIDARHTNGSTRKCITIPPVIYSAGLYEDDPADILIHPLPLLELQLIVIFTITVLIHFVLKRVGIPVFVSQLLTGIILGPTALGKRDFVKETLFGKDGQEALGMISAFGYMMYLFIMGVKMDPTMVLRTGKKALGIGVLAVLLPLAASLIVHLAIADGDLTKGPDQFMVIAMQSMSTFPVVATLLIDCKALNSELGRLVLSASLVSNMLAVFIMFCITTATTYADKQLGASKAAGNSVAIIFFLIAAVFLVRPAMFWMIRHTPEDRPVKSTYMQIILVSVFASAIYTNSFDQLVLFGPSILGLVIPEGPPIATQLIDKFESFIAGVFMPVYVTTAGMRVDLKALQSDDPHPMKHNLILIIVAAIFKLLGVLIPSYLSHMPFRDTITIATVMSYSGIVVLAGYTYSKDNKALSEDTFSLVVVCNLINSIIVSLLMKVLYEPSRKYAGYQKRNIMHVRPNSELRIVSCIHKPEDVAATIRLLDVSYATQESPIGVYVLHLIELGHRSTPVFICHQMKRVLDVNPYSQNVIIAFSQYERNNWGFVSVNTFTAMSPTDLMHEDITTLALNKATSLILLPFHRKWSIDGIVASEDNLVRTLNCRVLERSPCSIGILVDRPQVRKGNTALNQLMRRASSTSSDHLFRSASTMPSAEETSCSVGMIFFGGNDDREALTLAKRMARDSAVNLTVTRFLTEEGTNIMSTESVCDNEVLRDVKQNNVGDGYVIYVEEVVKDGPETALIIREMAEEYDLIIVGRRHGVECPQTTGLAEWSEFPELGVIGDLLASPDLNIRASVLIIQQQICS